MKRLLCATTALLFGCAPPGLVDPNLDGLRALAAEVDATNLMQTVTSLTNEHLADLPIDCATFDELEPRFCHLTHDRSRVLVMTELQNLGYTVRTESVADGVFTTTNVIADKTGATRPNEVVLIGAHYDAFWGGSDDNSSGVAAMLELARIFANHSFDRTVRFVGFDLEEIGLVGSTRMVDGLSGAEPPTVVSSIAFDCIGYSSSAPGSQLSLPGLPAPDQGDFIAVIANANSEQRGREVRLLNDSLSVARMIGIIAPADGASPIAGNLMRSDHAPFWLAGREALFFTDTANFRNPNYHHDSDLPATLDPQFLRDATELAAVTAAYIAGGPK